mmetsp:Transcript_6902/g.20268  ORF Transcript_6902/g.20268 Transcript_6902/m.20268 type:complete len:106 (-) Transcript_6902:1242-1559(-)
MVPNDDEASSISSMQSSTALQSKVCKGSFDDADTTMVAFPLHAMSTRNFAIASADGEEFPPLKAAAEANSPIRRSNLPNFATDDSTVANPKLAEISIRSGRTTSS